MWVFEGRSAKKFSFKPVRSAKKVAHPWFRRKRQKHARFMDDTLKTRSSENI